MGLLDYQIVEQHIATHITLFVDAKSFMILKEENILDFTNPPMKEIGEFPEGFYQTQWGPAPKSYILKDEYSGEIKFKATYEMVDNKIWVQKDIQDYSDKRIHLQTTNVFLSPVDPALFTIPASEIQTNDPTQGNYEITGKVIDIDTREPIAGARIRLWQNIMETRNPLKGETLSASDGSYRFSNLPNAHLYIITEKNSYLSAENDSIYSDCPIKNDERRKCSAKGILFTPDQSTFNANIYLAKPRTIKGKVVRDDNGEPVPGVSVDALSSYYLGSTKTETDGSFTFNNLPAQQVTVVAYAEGFAKTRYQFAALKKATPYFFFMLDTWNKYGKKIDVTANPIVDNITLRLANGKSITGIVKDIKNQPIERALITIANIETDQVISQKDGRYEINNIEVPPYPTTIDIVALAKGYVKSSFRIPKTEANHIEQDIVLQKGGMLKGIVKDTSNKPLKGVEITLKITEETSATNPNLNISSKLDYQYPFLANPGLKKPILSGNNGTFESLRLIPSVYTVMATAAGCQPYEQKNFRVTDEQITPIEIHLLPAKKISGIVTGPNGEALEGVRIQLQMYDPASKPVTGDTSSGLYDMYDGGYINIYGSNDRIEEDLYPPASGIEMKRQVMPVTTQNDGKFSFDQLEDGTYRLIAERRDIPGTPFPNNLSSQQIIENLHPGNTEVLIQFKETPKKFPMVRGHVIDKDTGNLIKLFTITGGDFYPGHPNYKAYRMDKANQPLPAGEFLIPNISIKNHQFWFSAEGYSARDVCLTNLKADEIRDITVSLPKEAIISGKLISKNISLADDFVVDLKSLDYDYDLPDISGRYNSALSGHFKYLTFLDGSGSFTFRCLSAGTFDFIVKKKNDNTPVLIKRNLTIKSGQTIELGDIQVDEAQKPLAVKIQYSNGNPIHEGTICLPDAYQTFLFKNAICNIPECVFDNKLQIVGSLLEPIVSYFHISKVSGMITIPPDQFRSGDCTLSVSLTENGKAPNFGVLKLISSPEKDPANVFSYQFKSIEYLKNRTFEAGPVWALAINGSTDPLIQKTIRLQKTDLHQGKTQMDIQFGNGIKLSGTVKNTKGEPVMGAKVFLMIIPPDNDILHAILEKDAMLTTRSAIDGTFHFVDVQAGKHILWAAINGEGFSKKQTIHPEENLEKEYEIFLSEP